ncbi:MAG: thermonuclease family protein [bacterium]
MEEQLYYYQSRVINVYDGDTVRADIDLGLSVWVNNEKLRLARINAPELRGEEREAGLAARDFLRSQVLDKEIIVETLKDRKGKYGRYLAELWVKGEDGEYLNVNDLMVQKGHAKYQAY